MVLILNPSDIFTILNSLNYFLLKGEKVEGVKKKIMRQMSMDMADNMKEEAIDEV